MIEERFNKSNTEQREEILDKTVLHFVYNDNETNPNYKDFVNLDYVNIKYP